MCFLLLYWNKFPGFPWLSWHKAQALILPTSLVSKTPRKCILQWKSLQELQVWGQTKPNFLWWLFPIWYCVSFSVHLGTSSRKCNRHLFSFYATLDYFRFLRSKLLSLSSRTFRPSQNILCSIYKEQHKIWNLMPVTYLKGYKKSGDSFHHFFLKKYVALWNTYLL